MEEAIDIGALKRAEEHAKGIWDFKNDDKYDVFDPTLSYEATGYKPITELEGLDFDVEWFIEARRIKEKTGQYCPYLRGSKRYDEYWTEQYKRCKYGYTSHGYTLTGDHYFFLNFYTLPLADATQDAGAGLKYGFPEFFVSQYKFFHYLALARKAHKHVCLMKARSIGFSEINASITSRLFTVIQNSKTLITCYRDDHVEGTFSKIDHSLTYLNTETDGGMANLYLIDKGLHKKAGYQQKNEQGQFESYGWGSEVRGVGSKDPGAVRGDRVDLLIIDEAGSNPVLTTTYVQGQELVEIQGIPRGTIMLGGTGGDSGKNLAGLRKIYENPRAFKVLPYRHNMTPDGTIVETGFFIPYYEQALLPEFQAGRGLAKIKEYKEYLQEERDNLLSDPENYQKKCAERCWTAEEAFQLEGQNKFNKMLVTNQLAQIKLHKVGPKPEKGYIDYHFKGNKKDFKYLTGFKWIPNTKGPIQLLEHPVWSNLYKEKHREDEDYREFDEMQGLYVAGIDGIDIGKGQTSKMTKDPSDFCMVIYKRVYGMSDPQVVCIYKERPQDIREAYKVAICLARYYNAKINIEATRMSIVPWAKEHDSIQYFMKRPRNTLPSLNQGKTTSYGTPATPAIIDHQTDLIAAYVEDYCYNIWFENLLDELIRYNDENKTKFDIIAAFAMALLADEELSGKIPFKIEKDDDATFQHFGYYKDENGYTKFGEIPSYKKPNIEINNEYYDQQRRDYRDPRLREVLDQYGIHW